MDCLFYMSGYNNHHEQQANYQATRSGRLDITRGEGQSSHFYSPQQAGTHQRATPQTGFGRWIGTQATETSWIEIKETDDEIHYCD